jgi:hypothetical protein
MASLLDVLFGCSHKNLSFPITKRPGQRRSPAASLTGTYVACLSCGKEFPFDWHEMRVVDAKAFFDRDTGRIGYGKSYGEYSFNGSPLHSSED